MLCNVVKSHFALQGECESHVARAVGSDEGNPEAWQTKARLSLVMEQFEVGMGRKLVFSD